ncbi:MAG: phosphoribosylanthranilate isomerase [Gemmatimonadetes bacterium]|nr:phosphoribosylanthranilate isomerase [Gemmatimonadota bacterium]
MKICCIASLDEAELAASLGAHAIGLVSAMPSGPGPIADDLIASIAAEAPRHLRKFLLTSRTDPDDIARQVMQAGTDTVQIVDALLPGSHARLRDLIPHVKLVQVIHVTNEQSVREAESLASDVDALLLDSGNPLAAVKELGGTGRTHDWTVSRAIVDAVKIPVWLAGGLRPENVADAIDAVRPYGVDVCSGVRTNGVLDTEKLAAFAAAIPG